MPAERSLGIEALGAGRRGKFEQRTPKRGIVQLLAELPHLGRIHRARRSFRQGRAALPWVHAIARNLYRSHSRSWAHRLQRASVDAEQVPLHLEGARDAEAHAIAHQRARALHDAISELGEGPRRALLLRAQGHGTSAVARHLGVSEGAVKLRCFRTFRTLRRTLKRLE